MINNNAMTDDKRAVEKWENEGGKVSPLKGVNASLRRNPFRAKDNSIETRVSGDQKRLIRAGLSLGSVATPLSRSRRRKCAGK